MALFYVERQPWQHWPKVVMVRKKVDGAERDECRRYVLERTCGIVWNETDETWECDACGGAVGFRHVSYCESCGARVKEEE